MTRTSLARSATILIILCVAVSGISAQEEGSETRLLYGPRFGGTWFVTDTADFTADMQALFGGGEEHFPAFTEIGISATHLIPLGETETLLTIEETAHLGGLDQQIALPSVSLLVGVRTRFGTALSVGPYISIINGSSGVELGFSLAYAASWSLRMTGFDLPIKFTFVPWPTYANPRLTLMTGVDFEVIR